MFANRNITVYISIKYVSTNKVLLYFILIYTGIYVLNGFERFKCAVNTLNGQLVTSVPA